MCYVFSGVVYGFGDDDVDIDTLVEGEFDWDIPWPV